MASGFHFKYPTVTRLRRLTEARIAATIKGPRESGNILVLHTGRSGSTVLGNMMDRHPQLFWDGEVIERLAHKMTFARNSNVASQFGKKSLADGIAHIARRMRNYAAGRHYGFELQHYHLDFLGADLESFLDAVEELGVDRFVILDRQTHLRKIVSHVIATSSKLHHSSSRSKVKRVSVRLNPKRVFVDHRFHNLRERLDAYESFIESARRLLADKQLLELQYGNDVGPDPKLAYRKLCAHVGVKPEDPPIDLVKTADFKLHELIENYDEVSNYLADTRHAWMAPPARGRVHTN